MLAYVSPDTDANASLGSPLQKSERQQEPNAPALKQTTARYSHPQADSPQSYGGIVRMAVHGENVSVAEMVERRRSAGIAARGERKNGGELGNDALGSRPGRSTSNTSPSKKSGSPLSAISPPGVNRRVRFQGDAELSPDPDDGVPLSSPAARGLRPEFPFTPGCVMFFRPMHWCATSCQLCRKDLGGCAPIGCVHAFVHGQRMHTFTCVSGSVCLCTFRASAHTLGEDRFMRRSTDTIHPTSNRQLKAARKLESDRLDARKLEDETKLETDRLLEAAMRMAQVRIPVSVFVVVV
jgi:hypothetical protein